VKGVQDGLVKGWIGGRAGGDCPALGCLHILCAVMRPSH
jgi:hypothetical protein